jgi:flagellar biosynthesis/type III secretory pathway protein FliH
MDGTTYSFLADVDDLASPRAGPTVIAPSLAPSAPGILYAEDFDSPTQDQSDEAAESLDPEPTFSAADLEAARAAGHEAGVSAAKIDAEALRADLHVAALQSLADAMAATRKEAADIAEQRAQALSAAVMAVLSAALPHVTETHAKAELTAVLEALLPGLRTEPVLRVRVHPDLEECVRQVWQTLSQDEPAGELQLTADATMARGDIRLSWADGRAMRNTADIWEAIRAALAPLNMPPLEELVHGH